MIKILKKPYNPSKEEIIEICNNALEENKDNIVKEILYLKDH